MTAARAALALALAAAVIAQDEPAWVRAAKADLASGDAVAVERARRRLATAAKADVPLAFLRRLVRHHEPRFAAAAGSVLLAHGEGAARLTEAVRGSTDAALWAALATAADEPALVAAAARGGEVARRALWELERRGLLADGVLGAALDGDDAQAGAAAAAIAVDRERFPAVLVAGCAEPGRRRVLEALAERPRPDAQPWLDELRAEAAGRALQLAILAASTAEPTVDDGRAILAAAAAPATRDAALLAADRLSPAVADRLVGEIHRRAGGEAALDDLLLCLGAMSPRGRAHLLGVARELRGEPRLHVMRFLADRDPEVVAEFVGAELDRGAALEPDLLRRGGPALVTAARRAAVVDLLGSEHDAELRAAAYQALLHGEHFEEALLRYALEDGEGTYGRVRQLLGAPVRIPLAGFEALLNADARVAGAALASLRAEHATRDVEPLLRRLALGDGPVADAAISTIFSFGSEEVVREVWGRLESGRRAQLAPALRGRAEPWPLELLGDTAPGDDLALLYTRMHLGDAAAFDELLRDPTRIPSPWWRRLDEVCAARLEPRHLPRVRELLAGDGRLAAREREHVVSWLVPRADLDAGGLLAEVERADEDEEVRYAARRALLRRPEGRALRARLEAAFGAPLDDELRDLAYEIAGAMEPPLGRSDARLLGHLLLVAPLDDPDAEIAANLPDERHGRFLDVPLLNMTWRLLRDDAAVGAECVAGFRDAVAAARAHANAWALGRWRLGGVLATAIRGAASRREIAPLVAGLLVEAPDLDGTFLGPAWLVLAERAVADGEHALAAERYRRAAYRLRIDPPDGPLLREFLGDLHRGGGMLPRAALAAQPWVCEARAALAAGEDEAAATRLARARALAGGDVGTEREIERLQREVRR